VSFLLLFQFSVNEIQQLFREKLTCLFFFQMTMMSMTRAFIWRCQKLTCAGQVFIVLMIAKTKMKMKISLSIYEQRKW